MAWSDFFNNMREALQKAEQEQKTPAQSGANTSLNDILRPNIQRPEITYGAHSAERNTPKKKTYQQVWGFEQDKANYGDERNGDNLNWRSLTVLNNDTGDEVKFDVGYDTDGRISGVRDHKSDGTTMGYYGKDLVSSFFKNNFDRDATDYTFFDVDEGDGSKWVLFDSEHDGAFIPSEALNNQRVSQRVPIIGNTHPDKPTVSLRDSINRVYDEMAARRGTSYALPNDEKENAAYNGNMEPMKLRLKGKVIPDVYDDFINKRPIFKKMVSAWAAENDPDEREQILRDYDKEYGLNNNPIFADFLTDLSWHDWGDKNDHENENAHFDYFGRMRFLDAMDEDFAFVEDAYNPYYRA